MLAEARVAATWNLPVLRTPICVYWVFLHDFPGTLRCGVAGCYERLLRLGLACRRAWGYLYLVPNEQQVSMSTRISNGTMQKLCKHALDTQGL